MLIEGKAQNTAPRLKTVSLLKAVAAQDRRPGRRRHSGNYIALANKCVFTLKSWSQKTGSRTKKKYSSCWLSRRSLGGKREERKENYFY